MNHQRDFVVVAGLVVLSFAFGGAGVAYPGLELAIEIGALAALGYFLLTPRSWRFNRDTGLALVLCALIIALPIIQLIPLPPELWHLLPGRSFSVELDKALGWSLWRPLSLDAEGTIRSVLSLLPALAVFIGCVLLPWQERSRLLLLVLAFAAINAVLGLVQWVTGGSLTFYASGHQGYSVGLFVNRNHVAALLLACMPIVAALAAVRSRQRSALSLGTVLTLSYIIVATVAVLGTTSRMALLILPLAIITALALTFRGQSGGRVALPFVIVVAAVGLTISAAGKFAPILQRFAGLDDDRRLYWENVQWALDHYGFAGTGFGTFVPVYQSAERLEDVTRQFVNHAHNDYLELLLEGGIPAAALFLFFLFLVGRALFFTARAAPSERGTLRLGAAAGVVLLMLSSLVDYPLRMTAIAAVFAIFCANLMPTRPPSSRSAETAGNRRRGKQRTYVTTSFRVAGLGLLAGLALLSLQAGLSAGALARQQHREAVGWATWSSRAHDQLASEALFEGNLQDAVANAAAAVRLSSIDASAVRTLGLVRLMQGDGQGGGRLMQMASVLGWRDPLTQLWAIDAAQRSGEPTKALQRAEALFRQDLWVGPALFQLLRAPGQQRLRAALAAQLAKRPSWRSEVISAAATLPAPELAQFRGLVEELSRTTAPVSDRELQPLVAALVREDRASEARQLWLVVHRRSLVTNGGFEDVRRSAGLFLPNAWQMPRRVEGFAAVEEPPSSRGNPGLRLTSTPIRPVVSQELMLAPGPYTLSYRIIAPPGGSANLEWVLRCERSGEAQRAKSAVPGREGPQSMSSALIVPERDCELQTLALVRVKLIDTERIWIDDVLVRSAGR